MAIYIYIYIYIYIFFFFFLKPPWGHMKVKFLGLKLNLVPPFPFDGGFMGRGMRRPES